MWPLSALATRALMAALLLVSACAAVWYVIDLRDDNRELEARLEGQTAALLRLQAVMQMNQEESNAYQKELARLGELAVKPPRRVLYCPDDGDVPSPAGGSGAAGAGRVSGATGRDIGPELYALADAADRCAAQRDALIRWASRVSATP